MSLLEKRNKLISIADWDGWDVVEYFEADPLTKNDKEEKKLHVTCKEAERSQEKCNRINSLRSKMGTRFKSQSTPSKSGPSVNFGQSHRMVDFAQISVSFWLILFRRKSSCLLLFWLRQIRPFHQGL